MTAFFMAAVLVKQSTRAFQSPLVRGPMRELSVVGTSNNMVSVWEELRKSNTRTLLFSTSVEIEELNEKIKIKGDEIRQLKADGIDKAGLTPHVEELLALKAQLPTDESSPPPPKKKPANTEKSKKANPQESKKKVEEMSDSELRQNRLAKVDAMKAANVEPFEYTFECNRSAAQLATEYEGKLEDGTEDEESDVAVAGRIMTRRVFGKLAFFTLQDETGLIQLQFDKTRLGDSFKVCFPSIMWTAQNGTTGT